MTWGAASFLVVVFFAILHALRVPARVGEVSRHSRGAVAVMRDKTLDDAGKARAMRTHALRLFVLFFVLVGLCALALALPIGLLALLDLLGALDLAAVLDTTLRWEFLLGTVVFGVALYLLRKRSA